MTKGRLKRILRDHGVPFKEVNGRVLADCFLVVGPQGIWKSEDVTDWSPKKLYVWLGYEFDDEFDDELDD